MQKFAMLNVYFREQHSHSSRYGFLCDSLGEKKHKPYRFIFLKVMKR